MNIKKYISLEEAQKLIPEIRRRLLKIMKLNKALEILYNVEIACDDEVEGVYREVRYNKKFHQLSHKLFSEMQALTDKGAVLNALEEGVVSFYSQKNRNPIFLCWKIGDRHIKYWHEVGEDFSARKPISKLKELDTNKTFSR